MVRKSTEQLLFHIVEIGNSDCKSALPLMGILTVHVEEIVKKTIIMILVFLKPYSLSSKQRLSQQTYTNTWLERPVSTSKLRLESLTKDGLPYTRNPQVHEHINRRPELRIKSYSLCTHSHQSCYFVTWFEENQFRNVDLLLLKAVLKFRKIEISFSLQRVCVRGMCFVE